MLTIVVVVVVEPGGESPLLQPEDDAPDGVPASLPRSLVLAAFFLIRDRGGVLALGFGDAVAVAVAALELLGMLRRLESRAAAVALGRAAGLPFFGIRETMPVRNHVSGRLLVKPGQTMPAELQLPHIGVLPSQGESRRRHSQHCGPLEEIVILAGGSSCCGGLKASEKGFPGWRVRARPAFVPGFGINRRAALVLVPALWSWGGLRRWSRGVAFA